MKASDYVIDFIARQGVSHVFEFIGGAITHLIDSISHREDICCVSVHHEQSAAFAAEAYSRVNGRLGVAMATSGPGALNMLTGIGSCYFDSVPCLFITGQVNTYEYKFDRPVRQIGFQETDIVSVAKPLTKYAKMVTEPSEIRYELEKAVYLARCGRPGPVLLDIPMNLQRADIDPSALRAFDPGAEPAQIENAPLVEDHDLDQVVRMIGEAARPVILAGGGVRCAGAAAELARLVERTGVPIVCSLMGLDVVPHDSPLFYGMIGAYGNRYSNMTLANSDFILVAGSRLDTRQTGTRPETFGRAAKKVHIDADIHELNAKIPVDLAIHADLSDFLVRLNRKLSGYSRPDLSSWYRVIDDYRSNYPTRFEESAGGGIDPNQFMEMLSSHCREGDTVCLDVGQNQMWAAQSFRLKDKQRMLVSGGMGAMGFAVPAALGAAKASGAVNTVAIVGDGGVQVNIQDLDTLVYHRLPVKIFVMNNGCLGMVRQFQDMYFHGNRQSTAIGYSNPDFCMVAEAYGMRALKIADMNGAPQVIDEALSMDGPVLVEVILQRETCVNPKLVVNCPIEDMSPFVDRQELADAMLIDLVEEKK